VSIARFDEWVLAVAVLGFLGWNAVSVVLQQERPGSRWRARRRASDGYRAAVHASLDNPVYDPERIRGAVDSILALARAIWEQRETPELSRRDDRQEIQEWAHARRRRLGAGLKLAGAARVDILGVVNREQEGEDRVTVRVRVKVKRPHA
jgi:hypothetical protein